MIDDETLAYLGPALLSGSGRALLAQMRAFTELGNLRGGVSVSTPAFCYLIKNKPSSPPLTPQGDSRASTSSLPPPGVIRVCPRAAVVTDPGLSGVTSRLLTGCTV